MHVDLKSVLLKVEKAENVVEFSKFVVFFGVDDAEVFDLLLDAYARKISRTTVDGILTVLVNLAHTLSPSASQAFKLANQEFGQRLRFEYQALHYDLYVNAEDLSKILTVLLDHHQLDGDLKQQVIDSIGENRSQYTFEIMADLAVIYATKMDPKYQELFFSKYMHAFVRNLPYLKEETLYQMLWSFVKADRLVVREDAYEWI